MSICNCLSIPLKEVIKSESGRVSFFFLHTDIFFHNVQLVTKEKKLQKLKGADSCLSCLKYDLFRATSSCIFRHSNIRSLDISL